jgi:hypothetical protein
MSEENQIKTNQEIRLGRATLTISGPRKILNKFKKYARDGEEALNDYKFLYHYYNRGAGIYESKIESESDKEIKYKISYFYDEISTYFYESLTTAMGKGFPSLKIDFCFIYYNGRERHAIIENGIFRTVT